MSAAMALRDAHQVNVVDRLAHHALDTRRTALVVGDEPVSYRRLTDLVDDAARALAASGALRGRDGVARIGLACPNGLAHVVLALGVLRGGACLVPIAAELSARECEALIRSVDLDAVLVADGAALPGAPPARRAVELGIPGIAAAALVAPWGQGPRRPAFDGTRLSALGPAFIRFSSGTTGASKGVVLSHRTLLERVDAANRGLRIGPDDRVLWMLPMAHHFAVSVLLYLVHGATTVLVRSHLAADVLAAARRHQGTVLYAAPFHHALLAGEPSAAPWPSLRLAVSTTAALPPAAARAFAARYGVPLSQALGIIEVGLPAVNLAAAADKPESVGSALPGFAIEVRDEGGRPMPVGEIGELYLRGPGMLDAYLSPWRTRAEALEDGWFASGDLATLDAEGDLRIVGRTRTVINVAGMKCFPEEIESVLQEHPGVRAARVSARRHARVGSVAVAEVVPADPARPPDASELAAHCRALLARFKVPVAFRIVDGLPTTPSGKIRR